MANKQTEGVEFLHCFRIAVCLHCCLEMAAEEVNTVSSEPHIVAFLYEMSKH